MSLELRDRSDPRFGGGGVDCLAVHNQHVEAAHLLLGLIRPHEGVAAQALSHVAVTEQVMVAELERLLPRVQPPGRAAIDMNLAFQQVLEDAPTMCCAYAGGPIGTEHLLLALIAQRRGPPSTL